ncbi:cobyric acid synthase CobQ, partial [Methanocaldococcus sp.]
NKNFFLKKIKESLKVLDSYDYVIMEGAGSCCEINLLKDDIANLRVAELVNAKAILVADIDRGGAFASIYGTIKLLPERWRKLIKGIIINKFRGNIEVLKEGIEKIEDLTNIPVLGVLEYDPNLSLPEEDSQSLSNIKYLGNKKSKIRVDVVRFKKISNYTDIDPLKYYSYIRFMEFEENIEGDILILPGSRSSTLEAYNLKENNFDEKIREFLNDGGIVLGICGGYQTLGKKIVDSNRRENFLDNVEGLNLLEAKTTFEGEKIIKNSVGEFNNFLVNGYEIHEGRTYSKERALLKLERGFGNCGDGYDGAIKEYREGLILGTYFHGIFENIKFLDYILNKVCEYKGLDKIKIEDLYKKNLEKNFDYFANKIRDSLNLDILL